MLKQFAATLVAHAAERNRDNIVRLVQAIGGGLLDLGCDDGAFSLRLARKMKADNMFGVELSAGRAALVRARGVTVSETDLNQPLPFEDATFDLVHSNQVIEHVYNIGLFTSEIWRVLRPGGIAIISTENLASWHNIAALFLGWQPFSCTNFLPNRSIGNPCSLYRSGNSCDMDASWCHDKVLAYRGLKELFTSSSFSIKKVIGSGYYPLPAFFGEIDVRHSHWITFKLMKL